MDAFFTIASPVPVDEPSVEEILIDAESTGTSGSHSGCSSSSQTHFRSASLPVFPVSAHQTQTDMDAFTIAPAIPAETSIDDVELVFVDHESVGTSGSHSGCVIA
ncbi:hypothetical protein L226DRAFT_569182 [Lentinus tigrinus ALCF2SS1-7]|uniref:uncharacterized protein n=1 Tax=Lentinus tigrinus ALCF2SS1-7 TaxID=1328758 RepID=UPI0011663DE9|nr:hypothetical protein L226DRAFT_569182 [Lentinus tigrinus ALCF2SS1-7]